LPHHVRSSDDGVEVEPSAGHLLDEVVGADVVRTGGTRRLGAVAGREDQHPGGLAGAVRRLTVPRTIWSALRGSTPRRMATSTVESNLVLPDFLANAMALKGV
jgi:hypothetical protein